MINIHKVILKIQKKKWYFYNKNMIKKYRIIQKIKKISFN